MSASIPSLGPREPWRHAALETLQAGWLPFPLPPGKKFPPPKNVTGHQHSRTPPNAKLVAAWLESEPADSNIGMRIPADYIGIDVDAYKDEGKCLREREKDWGVLPDTYRCTARQDGKSGIRIFKLPVGSRGLAWPGKAGETIEIIQYGHRYAVIWPSINPVNGEMYRWYVPGENGGPGLGTVPLASDVTTFLPARWVKGLTSGRAYRFLPKKSGIGSSACRAWLSERRQGEPCVAMRRAMDSAEKHIGEDGAHDAMTDVVHRAVMLSQEGHGGIGEALSLIQDLFVSDSTDDDRTGEVRTKQEALSEYRRARDGSVRRAMQRSEDEPEWEGAACRCLVDVLGGLYLPKAGTRTDQQHAKEVIRWISDRAVYAWDADSWVLKQEDRWKVAPKLEARGVVSLVAENMPEGEDPENIEPGDEGWKQEHSEWRLRERYQSSQKSSGISQKISALVTSDDGSSPYTTSLSDTDLDTGVLWTPAGACDLLRDRTPEEAIDRNAIHLHCTKYSPAEVETPCWDRLLAAVWPDAAVRQWALQCMAIGVTGLSPKLFIYLHGERDRGKTSVPFLISDVLGTYARADLNSSMISRDAKPWDRAALHGLRFGLIDEMPSGAGGPTEILKKITGGAQINAEYKNKPQFTFMPTHTLVFASNSVPDMHDDAVEQRLRAIACHGAPTAVRAARARVGEVTGRTWQREAPGVLWQLVKLARQYLYNPMVVDKQGAPDAVRRSSAAIKAEQNVLQQWLEENTGLLGDEINKIDWPTSTQIYDFFMTWCKRNHRGRRYLNESYSVDSLGRELTRIARRKGYIQVRPGGIRRWNIDLNPANIKSQKWHKV